MPGEQSHKASYILVLRYVDTFLDENFKPLIRNLQTIKYLMIQAFSCSIVRHKSRQVLHPSSLETTTPTNHSKLVVKSGGYTVNMMEDLILTEQHKHDKYTKTWGLWNLLVNSDEGKALF